MIVRLSKRLWSDYLRQNRLKASKQAAENRLRHKREALIVKHMPLAADIARQVWHRFHRGCHVTLEGNASIQGGYGDRLLLEDMISCAYVGLTEAAGRWDPRKGDFAKYCYFRVRGSVIDGHRRQNYTEALHESIDEWIESAGGNESQDGPRHEPRRLARYLTDPRPLAEEKVAAGELRRLAESAIDRLLPDEERAVILDSLGGKSVVAIAESLGQTPAWARAKLTAARDRVAAAVERRAA